MPRFKEKDGTPIMERLEHRRLIDPETGCWLWTGSHCGEHRAGARRATILIGRRSLYVSRVMATLCLGIEYDDDSIMVLHTCDNTSCFNPDHLYLGDAKDNIQDVFDRDRLGKLSPLCRADVFAIRDRLAKGESQTAVAKDYGVHQCTISRINTEARWSRLRGRGQ